MKVSIIVVSRILASHMARQRSIRVVRSHPAKTGQGQIDHGGAACIATALEKEALKSVPGSLLTSRLVLLLILLASNVSGQIQVYGPPSPAYVGAYASNLGHATQVLGDLDNDGSAEFAVGAWKGDNNGLVDSGYVRIYHGATGALLAEINGNRVNENFGESLAVTDVNGDGCPDLVVGAPMTNGSGQGRVAIYDGSTIPSGSPMLLWTLTGPVGSNMGVALAARDLNSDGFGEVVVGSPNPAGSGVVDVWSWQGATLVKISTIPHSTTNFGIGVACVDVIGGANVELVISDLVPNGQGNVRVYSYPSGVLVGGPIIGPGGASFGVYFAQCGDLNGDGSEDLAIAAPGHDPGTGSHTGSVFFYSGATLSLMATMSGSIAGESFGSGLGCAGDVDQDGVLDVAIGAPLGAQGLAGAGYVVIVSGVTITTGNPSVLTTIVDPISGNNAFGVRVGGGEDIDGDGCLDIVVGADQDYPGTAGSNQGAAYVFTQLIAQTCDPYPGSGEDFILSTGVNAAPTPSPSVKTATLGDLLTVHLESPGGTFDFRTMLLMAELFPTAGAAPSGPAPFSSILHITLGGAVVLVGPTPFFYPTLVPGGNTFQFTIPLIPVPQSIMLQGVVVTFGPPANNGMFATTEGHEIQVQ